MACENGGRTSKPNPYGMMQIPLLNKGGMKRLMEEHQMALVSISRDTADIDVYTSYLLYQAPHLHMYHYDCI